ncbi:ABC transporter ATP-binding protein [Fusobacterium russii]|uniref:ABC transporter ATP-binding protein n=1 Tax=Fusobacterium russii TaxID=854 RepID=UPI00039F4DC8|nr:ABC transporter ATP-binding protein [Fusobacterium russii]
MIKIEKLNFSYKKNDKNIFENLSIQFSKGFNVILGPNGAGKSTLMKAIFGLLDSDGDIFYGFEQISKMNIEEKIELMSYLPQMDLNSSQLTVLEMVLLGRLPSLKARISDEDLNIVMNTLISLNIDHLASNIFTNLSGGQKKLVFIAQTLVRYPKIILLDEPTNSLDLQKQLELCQLLKKISKERSIDLIAILHDINLAIRYADYIIIISEDGKIYSTGKPNEIINEKMLREVYGIVADISYDKEGKPIVIAKKSVRS